MTEQELRILRRRIKEAKHKIVKAQPANHKGVLRYLCRTIFKDW